MEIEYWPVSRLTPYAGNPREYEKVVPKLVDAIDSFGFRVPILAKSSGEVIDGHFRLAAAKEAGLEEVPVIPTDDMDEESIRAFRISINRMADLADWDMDKLKLEVAALDKLDVDLTLTGFEKRSLKKLVIEEPKKGSEDDPDNEVEFKNQFGVIVMCNDEADQEHVYNRLLGMGYSCKVVVV